MLYNVYEGLESGRRENVGHARNTSNLFSISFPSSAIGNPVVSIPRRFTCPERSLRIVGAASRRLAAASRDPASLHGGLVWPSQLSARKERCLTEG